MDVLGLVTLHELLFRTDAEIASDAVCYGNGDALRR